MAEEILTVAVPCFNEEGGIAATVAGILGVATTLPSPVRVFLVDHGSADATRARLRVAPY